MQQIKNSPLQLEKYFLKEIYFQVNRGVEITQEEFAKLDIPEIKVSAVPSRSDESGRKWKCELVVETSENKNIPYSFRIILIGFFSVDENYPSESTEILAKVNSPSILYSTAREMLTTTIRRSPFPPIVLPSLTFLELPDKPLSKEKSTKSVTKKARPKSKKK